MFANLYLSVFPQMLPVFGSIGINFYCLLLNSFWDFFFAIYKKNLNDFSGLTSSRVGIAPRVRTSLDILRLVSDPLELE